MADNIMLKTFDNSTVTPQNDAILYDTAVATMGIYRGGEVTYTGGNTLHISSGFGQIKGRQFEIYDSDLTAALPSTGSIRGRIYVHIDLANADEPAQIICETGSTFPDLEADEDINYDNGMYDMLLATFIANVATITDLENVAPKVVAGGGHANLQRNTAYNRGDVAYSIKAPSWVQLICTTAGTTANVEPDDFAEISYVGEIISDGTVEWTVADARMPEVNNLVLELDALIAAIQGGTDLLNEFTAYFNSQKALFNAETDSAINEMLIDATNAINTATDQCAAAVNTFRQQQIAILQQFRQQQTAAFASWFQGIRDKLDTDQAGHLQNEIDDIQDGANDITQGNTVEFLENGNIRTDYDDGRYKVTAFNQDGSIETTMYDGNGLQTWKQRVSFIGNTIRKERVNNG